METKQIDYYGKEDNYIHLKFGDVRKMYNFTKEFKEEYPDFSREYQKYWEHDSTSKFKNPFQIVDYAYGKKIPVHFYFNYTDTPAKSLKQIKDYLVVENSYIGDLN